MLSGQIAKATVSAEWVSAITNVCLFILTAVSVYYAYKAYNHQKERSRKEAACDLAKYYANNIIDKYSDISYVFDSAGLTDLVQKTFDLRDLQDFDNDELQRLLRESGVCFEEFEKQMAEIDPTHILGVRMHRACSADDRRHTYNSYTVADEEGNIRIINGVFLQADFDREIAGLLNELEWFSMNCNYGLADEELLYQSLHKTFLSTVWMLYFFISSRNTNNEDKLYTNVIRLFVEWRDRLTKILDRKEAEKQEYLDKANSVKAEVYEGTKLK